VARFRHIPADCLAPYTQTLNKIEQTTVEKEKKGAKLPKKPVSVDSCDMESSESSSSSSGTSHFSIPVDKSTEKDDEMSYNWDKSNYGTELTDDSDVTC